MVVAMPPLPPKPKVAPVVPRALVVAALATSACAAGSHRVRIGVQPPPVRIGEQPGPPEPPEPPPVRIGAEACAVAQIVDAQGNPLAGARVDLRDGATLTSDADGIVATPGHRREATVSLPGYATQRITFDCGGMMIVLEAANGDDGESPRDFADPPPGPPVDANEEPPRIGMPPEPVGLERPPPRIGKAPPRG
jgi:hypothetical protein